MSTISRPQLLSMTFTLVLLAFRPYCHALDRTWIGGNGTWTDSAANNTHWTGFDEPDPDDSAFLNTPVTVTMGSSNEVQFLATSAGVDLDLNHQTLVVHNGVSVQGAGTNVSVNGTESDLKAGWLDTANGGTLDMEGGHVDLYHAFVTSALNIGTGSRLSGFGQIVHLPILSAHQVAFANNGTISASRSALLPSLPPPAGALQFTASELALAKMDLDGDTEQGAVNIYRNQTLDIDVPLWDAFGGELDLFHNATLDIYQPWTFNGHMTVRSHTVAGTPPFLGIPAGTSYIAGGQMKQTGGLTVIVGDSTLQIDARFVMENGHIQNGGILRFRNNDAHIHQDALISVSSGSRIETSSASFIFGGQLELDPGADSLIQVATNHFLEFLPGSQTNLGNILPGNLRIHSNNGEIFAGASFSGLGSLQVESGSNLSAYHGSNVNVLVKNDGRFYVSGFSDVGSVSVKEFSQSAVGTLMVGVEGIAPLQADRLLVSSQALLDGTLDIDLSNSFVPSIADPLITILSAPLGVTGSFDSIIHPADMPSGLRYRVVYSSTSVQLKVVSISQADLNHDGAWDCQDVDALVAAIASGSVNAALDLTGDGLVNVNDLNQWLADAGLANLPSGHAYNAGDANLDGVVDGSDFGIWNAHKFTAIPGWCSGDFTADGVVDGSDFGVWNSHKFTSSLDMNMVPEPSSVAVTLAFCGLCLLARQR